MQSKTFRSFYLRHEPDLSRRTFLAKAAFGATGILVSSRCIPRTQAAGISHLYDDLNSNDYLGPVQIETKVEDTDIFTEGPAVDRSGTVYFTNIPPAQILKWSPRTKELSVFREQSNEANGLLFDLRGDLIACEGGAGRVTRTNMQTSEITVLADKFDGLPIGAPNDLTMDGNGRIYFTSRFGNTRPQEGNVDSVYRIDPNGNVARIIHDPQTRKPNGIVTSPDNTTLYLIEAHPFADHPRNIQAFDLLPDGSVRNQRTLIDFYPGRSGDGMCIDAKGNLYVAAGLHSTRNTSETLDTRPGIHVISPTGKLLAYRRTPEDTITNCSFGGADLKTLYVACGSLLLSIPTQIPGKQFYRPGR